MYLTVDMDGALVSSPSGVCCEGEDIQFEGKLYNNELLLQERGLIMSKDPATLQIDIVSDVMCPWCVIGYQQLAAALASSTPVGWR